MKIPGFASLAMAMAAFATAIATAEQPQYTVTAGGRFLPQRMPHRSDHSVAQDRRNARKRRNRLRAKGQFRQAVR